jgi:PKHD-type hydroxylase
MALEPQDKLPTFQAFATAQGFLSEAEIDRLIAEHVDRIQEAKLAAGHTNPAVRRSQAIMLPPEQQYEWLYRRVWAAAQECNRQFFNVDIVGVETNVQLGRYDASDEGHYSWHTDFAGLRPNRKISISVQLSGPGDYDGGDLELMYGGEPQPLAKDRGAFLAFPSFMLHRVTPVTRGTRWSLVAWILGNRWR